MNRREAILAAAGALLGGPIVLQPPAPYYKPAMENLIHVRNAVSGVLANQTRPLVWIEFKGTIKEIEAVLDYSVTPGTLRNTNPP